MRRVMYWNDMDCFESMGRQLNVKQVRNAMTRKIPLKEAEVDTKGLPDFMQVRSDFSVRLPNYFSGGNVWFRGKPDGTVFEGRSWISDNLYWRPAVGRNPRPRYMIHAILEWAGNTSAIGEPTPHITLRNAETQINIDLDISNPLPKNASRLNGTEATNASYSQGLGVHRKPGSSMVRDDATFTDLKAGTTQTWLEALIVKAQNALSDQT